MTYNRLKLVILICGFLLILVAIFFLDPLVNKARFNKFYNSNIEGKIVDISRNKGATDITVGHQKFTFVPTYIDNKEDFPYFAKRGDSTFKPAKSDTLKLIHNGKTYLYTFEKF